MVRIRLARVGLKKQPTYRIVVTDKRNQRDGKPMEIIGHYNPRTRPDTDVVDEARALYWLSVGAQASEAVESIFKRTGTLDRFARLKSKEATLEELVAEWESEERELPDPRTNYPAPAAGESKQKAREAARVAAEEAALTEAE
ncbi:30S ribosomal protein S16 [Phototrophicus methaneseepsis]|uniref:Small ribosomal subunit protein bS16 n=1 Tax=Phototrophicus methaneseepsis TaxID=2710758 RepID=A0A7S8E5R9_9CHLR|nr:30S ribosomal protein S16 [Phototrophicus methaneseepsis]